MFDKRKIFIIFFLLSSQWGIPSLAHATEDKTIESPQQRVYRSWKKAKSRLEESNSSFNDIREEIENMKCLEDWQNYPISRNYFWRLLSFQADKLDKESVTLENLTFHLENLKISQKFPNDQITHHMKKLIQKIIGSGNPAYSGEELENTTPTQREEFKTSKKDKLKNYVEIYELLEKHMPYQTDTAIKVNLYNQIVQTYGNLVFFEENESLEQKAYKELVYIYLEKIKDWVNQRDQEKKKSS